jgi:hypothetical protein
MLKIIIDAYEAQVGLLAAGFTLWASEYDRPYIELKHEDWPRLYAVLGNGFVIAYDSDYQGLSLREA